MAIEVGSIQEGKVTGIMNFGAFVSLPGGKSGLVHISEISNTFVKDVHDHLQVGQMVKVKVLEINEQGKISMSIKKAMPEDEKPPQKPRQPRRPERDKGIVWEPKPQKPASEMTFEDMMSRFKQHSEERISDIKRNTDRKNGSRRRSK